MENPLPHVSVARYFRCLVHGSAAVAATPTGCGSMPRLCSSCLGGSSTGDFEGTGARCARAGGQEQRLAMCCGGIRSQDVSASFAFSLSALRC